MLCEDLSQQAQRTTEEAERLQAELTAAKEKLEAEIAAKDTIEEKFAMLCEDLSQQAQQGYRGGRASSGGADGGEGVA